MGHILGLKFRDHGQIYYFDSGPFVVKPGDKVIVKTDQGMGLGDVVVVREDAPPDVEDEIKPIFRLAGEEDMETRAKNLKLAREAFRFCREAIEKRRLDMKLVDVEVFFDKSKIIFYFTAPGRIDFRELVKDLVKNYRTRIELRQIGVRHETQMIGAVGNCGQMACCRRFIRKFAPVTIKMAKEQNLFLNPTKISGICGRLLCCLSYEEKNYEEFYSRCPKIGKRFITDKGMAKVMRANFFRDSLSVIVDNVGEMELTLDEWQDLHPRTLDRADTEAGDDAPPRQGKGAGRPEGRRDVKPDGRRDDRRDNRSKDHGRDQRREARPEKDKPKPEADQRKPEPAEKAAPKTGGKIFMDAPAESVPAPAEKPDADMESVEIQAASEGQPSQAAAPAGHGPEEQAQKEQGPKEQGKDGKAKEGQGRRRRKRRPGKRR